MSGLPYRRDIDGLRAVAVLAVMVFHAFPAVLPGGFIGVDIFFVISGYLITSVLLKDAQAQRFSLARFYGRRIRRIFPALVVVMTAVLLAAWLLLLPREFMLIGKNTVAGALFYSNLLLLGGKGYFDVSEKLNPLLHLWSLGVEEQFYILWPLILFVCIRLRWRRMPVFLGMAGLSFAFNMWGAHSFPETNFYNPVTRFWELLVGASLAQAHLSGYKLGERVAAAVSFAGAALIIIGLFVINGSAVFPGWAALLPTLGAAFLILAREDAPINRIVLSNDAAVFIGLISYPLYLWHWPLLVFARLTVDGPPSAFLIGGLLLISFLAAWLTYRVVETPIRERRWPVGDISVLIGASATACLFGFLAYREALPPLALLSSGPIVRDLVAAQTDWIDAEHAVVLRPGKPETMFIGDSYMEQYYPRIQKVLAESDRGIVFKSLAGCVPFPGIERLGRHCDDFAKKAFARAAMPDIDRVVIAGSWFIGMNRGDYYDVTDTHKKLIDVMKTDWVFRRITRILRKLRASHKQVVLILVHPNDDPSGPESRLQRAGLGWKSSPPHDIDLADFRERTKANHAKIYEIARESGAEIVDPTQFFCFAGKCPTASSSGASYYRDKTHFRAAFIREHAAFIDKWVK